MRETLEDKGQTSRYSPAGPIDHHRRTTHGDISWPAIKRAGHHHIRKAATGLHDITGDVAASWLTAMRTR